MSSIATISDGHGSIETNEVASPVESPLASSKYTTASLDSFNLGSSSTTDIDMDIYQYYKDAIIPAISSSLPLLFHRLVLDIQCYGYDAIRRIALFFRPGEEGGCPWPQYDFGWQAPQLQLQLPWFHGNFTQFLLRNLDTDGDGHISASELLHMNLDSISLPVVHLQPPQPPNTWFHWFQYAWPLMDWKLGVFLWRSCGGLLLLIAIATIVPGPLHALSGRILRWPLLVFTYMMIAVELCVYIVVRLFIYIAETIFATKKHRALRIGLQNAKSYHEWYDIARKLDVSQGRDQWRQSTDDDTSFCYNWAFINELMSDMREARKHEDVMSALTVLQQCTRKNVGGIMNEDLFSFTNTGDPKDIVHDFLKEVVITLRWLVDKVKKDEKKNDGNDITTTINQEDGSKSSDNIIHHVMSFGNSIAGWAIDNIKGHHESHIQDEVSKEKEKYAEQINIHQGRTVLTFLRRARAAYGETCLCLSGGAMMGLYHFGHVLALWEEGVLPNIISGTSAGSVVAAIVCTRNDEELKKDLRPEVVGPKLTCFSKSWPDRIRNVYKKGSLFDSEEWFELIKWFTCGEMTFEEAFKKTGRTLCITLSVTTAKAPPVLLNHVTSPNITIASAIVASAAVPGFIKPVLLHYKTSDGSVQSLDANKDQTYWDGSIDQDIPMSGLAEMFNCQFFLAAQCNPHIVPFFHNSKGDVGRPSRWSRQMKMDSWRGGFLLAALEIYLKADMRSKFHVLNDLGAAVGFTSTMMTQIYGGTTTIIPAISFWDYFKLFSDPSQTDLRRYFQVGMVSAYRHCAMMHLHYSIACALDECIAILEGERTFSQSRRRRHLISESMKRQRQRSKAYSLNASCFSNDVFITDSTNTTKGSLHSSEDDIIQD